ncbi:hypothetical protein A9Q95_01435 [Rhodobacterales bacterium 59_46_T64]|nr:hypothetical protein A9Q95_01435 [Rhodobacterales bacterium 59_46_T64]
MSLLMRRRFSILGLACFMLLIGPLHAGLSGFMPVGSGMALAQDTASEIDYDAWEKRADAADEVIEADNANIEELDQLRAEIVAWRTRFSEAQSGGSNALQTVRDQIAALGPAPAEGEEEPSDIAAQRKALKERLAKLEAPITAANLAYSRADGIIRGIDQLIRDRQTRALLQLEPSPLNPARWPETATAIWSGLTELRAETEENWASAPQRAKLRANAPVIVVLGLLGLLLMLRGRIWTEAAATRVQVGGATAARWLTGFALSLGQVLLPLIGLAALTEAAMLTGLIGRKGDQILGAVPVAGFAFFAALWLGARMFPRNEKVDPPLGVPYERRRSGRLYAGLTGLVLGLWELVRQFAETFDLQAGTRGVLTLGLVIAGGVLLMRFARILRRPPEDTETEDTDETTAGYQSRVTVLIRRVLVVIAALGIVAAMIGYARVSEAMIFPALLSLQVFAFLAILQRMLFETYVLLTGNRESGRDGLVPVLSAAMLFILSLPVFGLIWGARWTDLTEIWTRFTEGFTIGNSRISPSDFLTFAVVFAVGYGLTRGLQSTLKTTVLPKTKLDVGGRNAMVAGVGYLGIFLAAVIAITSAGIDLSSLAIVAGALSVGIGFGLQTMVSNFVSGIILLAERPISEGDWIEVGGQQGIVRDISVRATRIETFDRTDVIVPNADLVSGTVTNYTRGNTVGRIIATVGVAYGTDTRRVETILKELAGVHPMVLANPEPQVLFVGFGADSLDFEVRCILRDVTWKLAVLSELNHAIAARFAEEEIEIPFAQRDVWLRNPDALQPSQPQAPTTNTTATDTVPPSAASSTAPEETAPSRTINPLLRGEADTDDNATVAPDDGDDI